MNNYYDVNLKKSRLKILRKYKNFSFTKGKLENKKRGNNEITQWFVSVTQNISSNDTITYESDEEYDFN